MVLPFTAEEFFNVFGQYNTTVWPMQVIIYLLAGAAVLLALKPARFTGKIIALILTFFWAWIGAVYHITFFTTINKAAYVFGALFVLQGVLFFMTGVLGEKLSFRFHLNTYSAAGALFILYGMVIYPVLGYFLGHVYPDNPTFGLPCPTTIFTCGLLLWTDKKVPKYLLAIPLLWSFLGLSAAVQLGVLEDIMLPITALSVTALLWYRDRTDSQLSPSYS